MIIVGRNVLLPHTQGFTRSSEAIRAWLSVVEMNEITRIGEVAEWIDIAGYNEDYAMFRIGRGVNEKWISTRHCRNTLMILEVGTQAELKTMEANYGLQITSRRS